MVSIRHQRNNRCVTIPQVRHKRHAHEIHIWSTSPQTKSNFLCLVRHIFVTSEIRLLPKTHRTRNMRHMRQTKRQRATLRRRRTFHHCTRAPQQDVSELVLLVQSWPRAARRKTQGTETDDTNDARGHHAQSITAPHRVKQRWNHSTQHDLPCDFLHDLGRCQRTCVLCSNAPHWYKLVTEKEKVERYVLQFF